MSGISNLEEALEHLKIDADDIEYGFACIEQSQRNDIGGIIGTFVEREGLTVIAPIDSFLDCDVEGPFAKLTIELHTSLDMVGLTALLAQKLADAGISANVVAGFYHDHVFVQYASKERAIQILEHL